MGVSFPMCVVCKHLHPGKNNTCKAFPHGIPDAILLNKHDHHKPYSGDRGILFEITDDPMLVEIFGDLATSKRTA
jgi:hypothetical protein